MQLASPTIARSSVVNADGSIGDDPSEYTVGGVGSEEAGVAMGRHGTLIGPLRRQE